jgi:O-antigen ligase
LALSSLSPSLNHVLMGYQPSTDTSQQTMTLEGTASAGSDQHETRGALVFVLLFASAFVALAASMLWSDDNPPSATTLTQCLAAAFWGLFVMVLRPVGKAKAAWPLQVAIALVALGAVCSALFGALPRAMMLAGLGSLFAAAVMVWAGASCGSGPNAPIVHKAFMWALLVVGAVSAAIGVAQVLAPSLVDGTFIAATHVPGRAVGNLHQPNLLSSLLAWAMVAVVALLEARQLGLVPAVSIVALLSLAMMLTGSRTGIVEALALAGWGYFDKSMTDRGRRLLMGAPALVLAFAAVALAWSQWSGVAGVGEIGRVEQEAVAAQSTNSRLNVWSDTLQMIRQQPWTGVGFGEFNYAWTLTPFAGRPTAFFDHTHNLILQLAVELGLPLAALVVGLLAYAAVLARRRAYGDGDNGPARRSMLWLVIIMLIHSSVEYPLWYLWFLLPTAFAWGFVLSRLGASCSRASNAWMMGLLLFAGGASAAADYERVALMYRPSPTAGVAVARVMRARHSVFFAYYADYVAATARAPIPGREDSLRRAAHFLLDPRLMMIWAESLAARGDLDKARYLAARLREFKRPEVAEFFRLCATDEGAKLFQCQPPTSPLTWRAFAT